MTVVIVVGLVIAGLALVAVEILLLPGLGLIGILGALTILASAYVAVSELGPTYAGLALAGGVVGAGMLFWLLPRTRVGRSMVLETRTTGSAGDPALLELLGREGVTLTPLRPAGTIEIDGSPVDVVSDGQYVEPGARVQITQVEGSRVVVEPL